MPALNLDQNILRAGADASAGDWAQAAAMASLDFRGAAELKRGINLEAGIGVMGELSAALKYFLAADLNATAQASARLKGQLQAPLDLFDEAGLAIRLQAVAEAAVSLRLALGLSIREFLELAQQDGQIDGLAYELLVIFLEELDIQAGVMGKAALSAMAYVNLVLTGRLIGNPVLQLKPGFTISAEMGVGLKAGAGWQMFARLGFKDTRRLVGRTIDVLVDETINAINQRLHDDYARSVVAALRAPAKIGLRCAFEIGHALYEQAPTFANNGDELARQCVRVALEEAQKALLEMLIRTAMGLFFTALAHIGISEAEWNQSRPYRDSLANLLRTIPREPFEATSQNLAYWTDLTNAVVNLGIQLGSAVSNRSEWVEPISILWSAAQLMISSVHQIANAQARVSFFGSISATTKAEAFGGSLLLTSQTPTAIFEHINATLGRSATLPIDQDTLVEYLLRDVVLERLLHAAPEAGSLIAIFAGADANGAVAAAKVIMRNINSFVPKADGSGYDPKKSLRVVADGLEVYIGARIQTELRPILDTELSHDPLVQIYVDEVILPSLLFTSRTLIRRTLDWGTGALTARDALREACSSIVMKVLGRSAVVTADVLIAATLEQVGGELNRRADQVRVAGGIAAEYKALVTATHTDEELVGEIIEETLHIAADVFSPQPMEVRAQMRALMYDLLDTVPASADDNWIEQLQHDLFIPNARVRAAIFDLSNLAAGQLVDVMARFLTGVLAKLAKLVLRELTEFAGEIQLQIQQWIDELTRSVAAPNPHLRKIALVVKVQRLQLPPAIQQVLGLDANALAELHAYSLLYAYDPAFQGDDPIGVARNFGGLVLRVHDLTFTAGPFSGPIKEALLTLTTPGPNALQIPRINTVIRLERVATPGLTLESATLAIATDPFTARLTGEIKQLDLGLFRIEPLAPQRTLLVTVDAVRGQLHIDPARMIIPVLGPRTSVRIHGKTRNAPFTYAPVGPWSANITFEGETPLEVQAGGETVLYIQRSHLQSASVSRDAGVMMMVLTLTNGSTLTAFPGRAFQQSFILSTAATLMINSDGQFTFNAAVNNQVVGGVTLRGQVLLTNEPDLRFTVSGVVVLPALGGISIVPQATNRPLEGRFAVQRGGNGALEASLQVRPARLTFTTVLGTNQSFLIDGGPDNQDFTFSTNAPWNARLRFEDSASLELRAAGISVFRTDRGNLVSAAIARDVTGVMRMTVNLAASSTLAAFPGQPFTQSLRLASRSTLTIASNGTFSLSSTLADGLILSRLPIAELVAASINVTQSGFVLTGTARGGVLALAPVVGMISSTVSITASGVSLTGNANVTVSPLAYGEFRISPLNGTTFTATLNNSGLTVPSGLRLSYRGTSLGTFSLPSFTIPTSGDYSFTVGPVSANLNGFNLVTVNFTFRRQSSVVSIPNFTGTLSVPRPGGTLATVSVSGGLNSNGMFNLTGSTSANISLTAAGLPVNILSSGATLNCTQSNLTLQGSLMGGVLAQVTPVTNVTGILTISANGNTVLSGSATIQPIVAAPFRVQSASGGNITATMNNNGLSFSGVWLRADGILGTPVGLPAFTMPANGNFELSVNPSSMAVLGIPCASINFTLRRYTVGTNKLLSLQPFSANLNISSFSQRLTGSINSEGSIMLDYAGSLTLGGFTAANGTLHLRNSGLSAEGAFTLRYNTTTFGQVDFSGRITYNPSNKTVSYNLGRTSGGIQIGGISIPSPKMTLSPGGASGSATLPFGPIPVLLNNLNIASSNGLNFNQYNHTVDSSWILGQRLAGRVVFRASEATFTARLDYAWASWIGLDPPANINDVPSPPRFSGSGSIGSDGRFTVSGFTFELW